MMFKDFGIPVYISDNEAKIVMATPEILTKIVAVFGNEVLGNDLLLKRDALASIVFNDSNKLKQLNAIVHPEVKKHFELWVEDHNEYPFVIKETAILFESGSDKMCDKIISVTAPLAVRIKRVMDRDKSTEEKVLQRITAQIDDDERIKRSDFVINNSTFIETRTKVETIIRKLGIV